MALHSELDLHLRRVVGVSGYSVSGNVATITANLDHRRIEELIHVAQQVKHDVVLSAGALKVQPH